MPCVHIYPAYTIHTQRFIREPVIVSGNDYWTSRATDTCLVRWLLLVYNDFKNNYNDIES